MNDHDRRRLADLERRAEHDRTRSWPRHAAIDVRTYGAVGDGITNDTAAIQAAIQAAGLGLVGGFVLFPAGVYRLTGTLVIDTEGVWLIGDGLVTVRLTMDAAAGVDAVQFTGVVGPPSGIRHIEINRGIGGTAVGAAVRITNSNAVYLEHVWVNGFQDGILWSGCGDCFAEHTYVELCSRFGYHMTDSAPMHLIDCRTYQNLWGFYITGRRTVTGTSHHYVTSLIGCAAVEDVNGGFYVNDYLDVELIAPSVSSRDAQAPIQGITVSASERIVIDAPKVAHAKQFGIWITGASKYVDISNMQVDAVGHFSPVPAVTMWGVLVEATAQYINIIGGSISNCYGGGLYMAATGQVVGVNIIDTGLNNNVIQGIDALVCATINADTLGTLQVIGCTLRNTGPRGVGLSVPTGGYVRLIANRVSGFITNYSNLATGNVKTVANSFSAGPNVGAAATDLATVIALANNLRTVLIEQSMAQT